MILRYNDVTKVKFKNDKAEIIVKCKYKLTIILRKNKIIMKYNDDIAEIRFWKFNTEEIANAIYGLMKEPKEFDIEVIKDVLQMLKVGWLFEKLAKKLAKVEFSEGDKIIEELEKFINRVG